MVLAQRGVCVSEENVLAKGWEHMLAHTYTPYGGLMQWFSLTPVIVMFSQQWSFKASPLAIPFHL